MNTYLNFRLLLLCICIALFNTGCSSLTIEQREFSPAFNKADTTSLGTQLSETKPRRGRYHSGFLLLDTGQDALKKRLALLDLSEQSVDLQYYIWNSDRSGRLMADRLLQAADRGVRIRLLLDDFNVGDRDTPLVTLDAHPNIEVRIYNPNQARSGIRKIMGLLGNFGRLNQRMHNKTFTVDASVSIVGGRNIGDEYFDLHSELNFRDRDLLAVGPIVGDISKSFDAYWNNERAFSITSLVKQPISDADVVDLRARLNETISKENQSGDTSYVTPSVGIDFPEGWQKHLIWAPAKLVYDQPLGFDETTHDKQKRVAIALQTLAQDVLSEVLIESAYLIPGDDGVELLGQLVTSGVRVAALTNSMASNDLLANHSGYTRRRDDLLERGVELFELRPDAKSCQLLVLGSGQCDEDSLFGLHAKSIVFDRRVVFVGSFNLNQRSVYLNTETALIVYSHELADRIAKDIEQNFLPENSWHVIFNEEGDLEWQGREGDKIVSYLKDPQTGFWQRLKSGFFSVLPFEKYL